MASPLDPAYLALAVIVGGGVGFAIARARPGPAAEAGDEATPSAGADVESWDKALRELVRKLQPAYEAADHPAQMADEAAFASAAALVAERAPEADDVARLLCGHDPVAGCIAGEALGARDDVEAIAAAVGDKLSDIRPWSLFYGLPHLAVASAPSVGEFLFRAPSWWSDLGGHVTTVGNFVDVRVERGEQPSFGDALDSIDAERAGEIEELIRLLDRPGLAPLGQELRTWRAERTDRTFLSTLGRVWDERESQMLLLSTPALEAERDTIVERLRREPPRSVLIVGDAGVGKSSLVHAVGRAMAADGWTVLEAGGTSLLADQVYIGSLEGRVRKLLDNLDSRRRVLWYVPAFHELLVAGMHNHNRTTGVLDMVLPAIAQGRIVLIGEIRGAAFERLLAARPHLPSDIEVVRLAAASRTATVELGEVWSLASAEPGEPPLANRALIDEAMQLADNLLAEVSAPGNLLTLLELARRHRTTSGLPPPLTLDDLLDTLSALSGLPRGVLDDRQRLDLGAVRARFEAAVVGQAEAVDCLVDRIAMIKAGLTDPGRPLAVFLLVGPTGTGKTELAKTLAHFLFGSPERMARLDMSEFQDHDSLARLVGDSNELGGPTSLAGAVRRQPFSVVLLDEFEKAHRNVWDLFLQVFDDGRLTDRLGNTADFRHTIILLTSNLGASIGGSTPIGFVGEGRTFSPSAVQRAVKDTFRPEFLNRLDRVIVFEPLSRSVMREILRKELDSALQRRGLRTREWAVEWEESVVEFLLERGFTAELGARPLRRAIERYVLGPLSATIVEHRFPDGDQFLFLRSDGKAVQAEFVDPDAPDDADAPADPPADGRAAHDRLPLAQVALAPRGAPEELSLLETVYETLCTTVASESWQERKQDALNATRAPGFWERADRAEVFGDIEVMDRIEAALETAGSLARRLRGGGRTARARFPAVMLGRLAGQLHVIGAACDAFAERQPQDALLAVEAFPDPNLPQGVNQAFASRIADMYRAWAGRRNMRLHLLEAGVLGDPVVAGFAVSGLGAHLLLAPEEGLHVLEVPDDARHSTVRVRARVRVVPQPDGMQAKGRAAAEGVRRALAATDEAPPAIVRHYREAPSPLVRDRVRGWRTGRIDRVLGGDFDLIV